TKNSVGLTHNFWLSLAGRHLRSVSGGVNGFGALTERTVQSAIRPPALSRGVGKPILPAVGGPFFSNPNYRMLSTEEQRSMADNGFRQSIYDLLSNWRGL